MKRIGVIGDLHLGKLKRFIPDHLQLQIEFIKKILKRISDEGIKEVVFLGDVFDRPEPDMEIQIAFLDIILQTNLTLHWVCGNHDKNSEKKVAIDFFEGFAKKLPNLNVWTKPSKYGSLGFLPYPHKEPVSRINFAHTDRPGAVWDNGMKSRAQGKWDEKKIFILGHIHKPQTLGKSFYTGSPFQLSFGESLPKYYGIVEYEKNHFEYIPVRIDPPYSLFRKEIKSKKSLDRLLEKSRKEKSEGIVSCYQLHVKNDFRLPENLLLNNSNFSLATTSKTIPGVMESMKNESFMEINPMGMLESWLVDAGMGKRETAWAIKQVRKVLK